MLVACLVGWLIGHHLLLLLPASIIWTRDSQPFLNGDTLDKTYAIP
jgi:hypothetical protein